MVDDEDRLLRQHGHTVEQIFGDNGTMPMGSLPAVARSAVLSWWNPVAYRDIRRAIWRFRPDVVHVHNTFAALSPSVLWAAKRQGVPVVLTVHNYRLLCAAAILLRDGAPCEECVGRWPIAAIRHRCQFSSSSAIGTCTAIGQAIHRILRTYQHAVDAFVASTEFQRGVLIRVGIPASRIHVKPNSSQPFPLMDVEPVRAKQIAFVGFVGNIKGIDLLLPAWQGIEHRGFRLAIIGDAPEAMAIRTRFAHVTDVDWMGALPRESALAEVARSRWLVLPSRWYEAFPVVLAEALAEGTPVVVPNHGGFPEIVESGKNALLFPANDVGGLARVLSDAIAMNEQIWLTFSERAGVLFRSRYSADASYRSLIEIYDAARCRLGARGTAPLK